MKKLKSILVVVVMFSVLILAYSYSIKIMFFSQETDNQVVPHTTTIQMPTMSRMSLTAYDKELARQMMDKNNDGKCDACGMPIEMCMDSGQLQCNMDPDSTIGILGSQHIHADWKVYINGKKFDWAPYVDRHEKQMSGNPSITDTSAFIHIHPAQVPEKGGDLLHMHSTGVPLFLFFKSLGIELSSTMKLYVNGKFNPDGLDYVFKDGDKLLLTVGNGDLQQQLDSITDFSKNH